MPWNGSGVYSRAYPSWGNDANSGLPISSTKFDLEDNDFASGIQNCLTIDGQNKPNTGLLWTLTSAQVLGLLRGSDGSAFSAARVGGTNNPAVQIQFTDATGATLALTTAQQLSFSTGGTNRVTMSGSTACTVTGIATFNALSVTSPNSTGNSFGIACQAGTNATDYAILVSSATGTPYFKVVGNGVTQAVDDGGTFQTLGWRDLPNNLISSNYTVVHADRGRVIQCNANNLAITFPNDSTFPVGSTVTIDTGGATGTTIAVTAPGMLLWYNGSGTTGTRSVASFSMVTVMYHNTSTGSNWALTGSGIS